MQRGMHVKVACMSLFGPRVAHRVCVCVARMYVTRMHVTRMHVTRMHVTRMYATRMHVTRM